MLQQILYTAGRLLVLAYTRIMLRMDVSWQDDLPPGPKLIVVNHPSTSDPFYLTSLFRTPIHLLLIQGPFIVPVFGSYLRRTGHVAVVPGNRHAAYHEALALLRKGHSVAIYPEGTVSPREGGMSPLRTGAARLALETGVPVVPVGIYLNRSRLRAMDSSIRDFRGTGYWYLRGPYHVTVGPSLRFEAVPGAAQDREHVARVSADIGRKIAHLARQSEQRAMRSGLRSRAGVGAQGS